MSVPACGKGDPASVGRNVRVVVQHLALQKRDLSLLRPVGVDPEERSTTLLAEKYRRNTMQPFSPGVVACAVAAEAVIAVGATLINLHPLANPPVCITPAHSIEVRFRWESSPTPSTRCTR